MAVQTSAFRISDLFVIAAAAAALLLSVQAAAARSGAVAAPIMAAGHVGSGHAGARAPGVRPFAHHHRGRGAFLPAVGAFAYSPYAEPVRSEERRVGKE